MEPKLIERWNGASLMVKIGTTLAAVAIIAAAIGAAFWALQDRYQPLFSELDPGDAAAIAAELERMKVAYTVSEDGTTIFVDKGNVHVTRLKVMGKGLDLKGPVGFEIFNNTDFGMTEFAQKINYQRALQGELARTITALQEVKSARVHLVLPESGPLRRNTVKPKASVTLAMRGGQHLHPEQIQGIQRLVAAAVPEMEPSAVTILDQQGIALSRRSEPGPEGDTAGAQLESKREIESYLTRKVVAVLDQAFGPGKAIVSVDVTLDYDQVKVTQEDVLPGSAPGGVIVRRKDNTQHPAPLVATSAGALDGTAPRAPTSASSEIEYLHGRRIEQIVSGPGSVRRISVGVLLPQSLDAQQTDSLKQVIGMTVGLNFARGDAIAFSRVSALPAANSADALPAPAALPRNVARNNAAPQPAVRLWLTIALAVALFAVAAAWFMASRRRSRPEALSERERQDLLARLREWVSDTPPSSPGMQP